MPGKGYGPHRTCKARGKQGTHRIAHGHTYWAGGEEISHEAGRVWVSQWDNFLTDEAWAAEVGRGLGLLPKAEEWSE